MFWKNIKVTTGLPSLNKLGSVPASFFDLCKGRKIGVVMEGEDTVVALRIGFIGQEAIQMRERLGIETETEHDCVMVHYTPTGKVMLANNCTAKALRNEGLLE